MNPTMLGLLSRAAVEPCKIDRSDQSARAAAEALQSLGLIRIDLDWCAVITPKGRAALSEYHAEQKRMSKQRSEDAANRREDHNLQLVSAIIGAVVGSVATIIIQWLLGMGH